MAAHPVAAQASMKSCWAPHVDRGQARPSLQRSNRAVGRGLGKAGVRAARLPRQGTARAPRLAAAARGRLGFLLHRRRRRRGDAGMRSDRERPVALLWALQSARRRGDRRAFAGARRHAARARLRGAAMSTWATRPDHDRASSAASDRRSPARRRPPSPRRPARLGAAAAPASTNGVAGGKRRVLLLARPKPSPRRSPRGRAPRGRSRSRRPRTLKYAPGANELPSGGDLLRVRRRNTSRRHAPPASTLLTWKPPPSTGRSPH